MYSNCVRRIHLPRLSAKDSQRRGKFRADDLAQEWLSEQSRPADPDRVLDTHICVEVLRGNEKVIRAREEHDDDVGVSFMSVAELFYGAARSSESARNEDLVQEFLLSVEIVQSDLPILRRFGALKGALQAGGALLPDADLFVASTAYEKADLLVTANARHFERFQGLRLEDWTR